MKYIGSFLQLIIIPALLVLPLLVIVGIGIGKIQNNTGMFVALLTYGILFIPLGITIVYKSLPKEENLPKVTNSFALFSYALFISIFASGYSGFFTSTQASGFGMPLLLLLIALFFLFLAYREYFKNHTEQEKAHDFLLSLSASLIVGMVVAFINHDIELDNNAFFLIFATILFVLASVIIVWKENKEINE